MIEEIIRLMNELRKSLSESQYKEYLEILKDDFNNDKRRIELIIRLIEDNIQDLDSQEKNEEEKSFESLLITPNYIPLKSKQEEETIKDIIFNFEESYKIPFPPPNLTDSEKNKRILEEYNLNPYLFYYLRTLTHPYKQRFSDMDKAFLSYLIDIESWDIDLIQYLLSGLNDHYEYFEYNMDMANKINYIEKYIDLIEGFIKDNEDRIKIKLSNESLELRLKRKKTLFKDDVSLQWFNEYMNLWGSLHIAIKQK